MKLSKRSWWVILATYWHQSGSRRLDGRPDWSEIPERVSLCKLFWHAVAEVALGPPIGVGLAVL